MNPKRKKKSKPSLCRFEAHLRNLEVRYEELTQRVMILESQISHVPRTYPTPTLPWFESPYPYFPALPTICYDPTSTEKIKA